jgi:copper/silver efflux system protein
MLWLYGESWFMNFSLFGMEFREFLQMEVMNLSVAVWVGFLAVFGIAVDDGVIMSTYLDQLFKNETRRIGNRSTKPYSKQPSAGFAPA